MSLLKERKVHLIGKWREKERNGRERRKREMEKERDIIYLE